MSGQKKVVVLGGGAGGLTAAWLVSGSPDCSVSVYEKTASLGGSCGSFKYDGFNLDYGPHKIYSVIPGIMDLLEELGGDKLIRVKKRHRIILKGKLISYPVRLMELPRVLGCWGLIQCAFSILSSAVKSPWLRGVPRSYKDYVINRFGHKLYDFVFEPLAEKTWGDPETLSADIALTRIPGKGAVDLLLRTLRLVKESGETQADYFLYPKEGFGGIIARLAEEIEKNRGVFYMERFPVRAEVSKGRITSLTFNDGGRAEPDVVISSMPLIDLTALLFPEDASFRKEVLSLEMRNLVLAYLFVDRPKVLDDQWIFCPDKDLVFGRLSEQKLMSSGIGPENRTVICCDFTCGKDDWRWLAKPEELAARCAADLEKLGLIREREIYGHHVIKIPAFYPRYGLNYRTAAAKIFKEIGKVENLICTGRLSLYNYNNFDHCVDMGQIIAKGLRRDRAGRDITDELIRRSGSYRIVD